MNLPPRTVLRVTLAVIVLTALAACSPSQPAASPPPPQSGALAPQGPPLSHWTPSVPPPTTTMPMPMPTTTMPSGGGTTMPGMGGVDQCVFVTFCDAFQTKNPGGRGGDVDESKWSLSRLSQENVPSQGTNNKFVPVNAEFCTTKQVRLADSDSFICGQEFGESNHWMEAINDNGNYVMNANRITQPFDFAGRTGTFDFSVDAKSTGGHGSWIEAWLTADPMQSPHTDKPGTHIFPRSGIGFEFDRPEACAGGMTGQQANSMRLIDEFHNYVNTVHLVNSPCFTTQDDHANHFQIKVSQSNVQVWVSDAGGGNFRQIASVPVSLDFTRGYWSLEHAQYNAAKAIEPCECGQNQFTYHWHAVSFDGPMIAPDRDYQVPDSLRQTCAGYNGVCGINLGYTTDSAHWSIPSVNLTGAASAALTYNAWYTCCNPRALQVTVNGHIHQVPDPNPDITTTSSDVWRYAVVPLPLSELQNGTNTVTITMPPGTQCNGSCPSVANIDLELTSR